MTNAEYQTKRITQGHSLIATLHKVIEEHCQEHGLEPVFAMRDALTDMHHLADVYQLDFEDLEDQAYDGYLEELGAVWKGVAG